MQLHKTNTQPAETRGKLVTYKNRDVFGENGKPIEAGRWHMPAPADDMNWKTKGNGCATIGAVEFYQVVN